MKVWIRVADNSFDCSEFHSSLKLTKPGLLSGLQTSIRPSSNLPQLLNKTDNKVLSSISVAHLEVCLFLFIFIHYLIYLCLYLFKYST